MMRLCTRDLVLGLLWLGCAAALQVHITPDLRVSVGHSTFMRCQVVGDVKVIDWYNPYGQKILPDNPSFSVSRDDQFTSTLTISRASEDHAGTFTCVAKASGQKAEARVHVLLYQSITFNNAPSPQQFEEGTDADVVCEVFSVPAPEIQWKKEDRIIDPFEDRRFEMYQNGHLLIRNIQKADEGLFYCEARILRYAEFGTKAIHVIVNSSNSTAASAETSNSTAL